MARAMDLPTPPQARPPKVAAKSRWKAISGTFKSSPTAEHFPKGSPQKCWEIRQGGCPRVAQIGLDVNAAAGTRIANNLTRCAAKRIRASVRLPFASHGYCWFSSCPSVPSVLLRFSVSQNHWPAVSRLPHQSRRRRNALPPASRTRWPPGPAGVVSATPLQSSAAASVTRANDTSAHLFARSWPPSPGSTINPGRR